MSTLEELAAAGDFDGIFRTIAAQKAEAARKDMTGPMPHADYWKGYLRGQGTAYQSEHENEAQLVRIARYFGGDARNAPVADPTIAGFVLARAAELRGAAEAFITRLEQLEPHLASLHAHAQNHGMPWAHGNYANEKARLKAALGVLP